MKRQYNIYGLRSAKHGFTLVEMLIVGALIALFSGLAVFSISTQLNLNKQKAAVGECRQIATSMSFALQDTSFYPKLCFLQYNSANLIELLRGAPLDAQGRIDILDYHGNTLANAMTLLQKQWKGTYLAFNRDKIVQMKVVSDINSAYSKSFDWPASPFGNPYVVYLLHTIASTKGAPPTQRFLATSGDAADNLACVVSYGRNHVPGMGEVGDYTRRKDKRLFHELDSVTFQALKPSEYNSGTGNSAVANPVYADMIKVDPQNPDPDGPRIREVGSDDRYLEF